MFMQAYNPYLPSYEYIPDGEPYVFDNRVYIYGSHDRFNGSNYCLNNYVCWSAPIDNLCEWKYEGVIFQKIQDPIGNSKERLLFAPDVQKGKDGRYYLYYAFDFQSIISVAVCDEPAGNYKFYGYVHYKDGTLLGKRNDDAHQFDPGVLVDDDGKVYLYSGFCPNKTLGDFLGLDKRRIKGGMVIELEPDMITIKVEPKYIFPHTFNSQGTDFEGHEFFEASSIRKINDTYYFIYSSINGHELCYATSKSPIAGFKYGGTIISNGDIFLNGRTKEQALNYTGNNHGSIVEINDQWYVFYHRHTNAHQFSRQPCAEKIKIEVNGSIKQVEMTSCGLNNGPLLGKGEYEARIACNLMSKYGAIGYGFGGAIENYHPYFTQDGEDREDTPNQYIANMSDGAVAGFKYFNFNNALEIIVKVRGQAKGEFYVKNALDGEVVAIIKVNAADYWTEYKAELKVENGVKPLYFTYIGKGVLDFHSFSIN